MSYQFQVLAVVRENFSLVLLSLPLILLFWYLWTAFRSPLRQYPGPLLAKWTNLWRLYHVSTGNSHQVFHDLHKKYGPIVRLGPNLLDLDYPELIKTIYNIQGNWKKTEMYHGSSAKAEGKIIYNLFSETNQHEHSRQKRPIAKLYSATGVLALETHMDQMIQKLCEVLATQSSDKTGEGKVLDLGEWLLYFAWDLVGEITFSQPIGYLDKGHDFDGTLANADQTMDYFAMVAQMPFLDYIFDKNPVCKFFGPPGFATITQISIRHLLDRYAGKDGSYHDASQPDYLDHFIEAKKLHPDIVDDAQIISYLMINMIAGADTTAITMRAVFYYALKDPAIWTRLEDEVLGSPQQHHHHHHDATPLSLKDARRLPYLDAVIREAMRIHPGVGMSLERYVPPEGLRLPNGQYVPAGSVVGINPWVVHRNPAVFGADPDMFKPERWLRDDARGETEDAYQSRLRRMNQADLTFGAGSRVCIGKHISTMEVLKVIPSLISQFRFELDDPKKEWNVVNSFFVRQTGLKVRIQRR
ncbi:hypothetical protein PFICI_13439 [Pestalotiopsis fici W106-1]|uniref:Cytochrome P450 n=1 Tax=Pestalotiopsis fici (strain W106-1 / CGMCC3.15140) TaxID=1229662 RepID=W3WM01_PESFW|nr:uncharacterized protein PFICI_13439 [Pestalotiopsis fici W106-1]ETS74955.1 hypothetical protein PFICI_13439 [Pestalotiopsis fici W106-1]